MVSLFCDLTIYEDGYIDIDVITELNTSYGLFYDRNALKEPIVIKINKRISNLLTNIKAYTYVEPNKGEEYSERDKAIINKRRRHYYSKKTWVGKKLLKSGYQIVDITSAPDNRYLNFIFKNTEGLEDAINTAIEKKNNKRKERRHHGYSEHNDGSVRISPEDLMKKFDEIKQQIQAVADNKIIK